MDSFDIKKIQNDDDTFLEFMKLYRLDLYKTALAFLKNKDEALEAIQEVTYRAYKKRKQLKQPEYLKTWLIRIMINYCQDILKKQKRMHPFINQEQQLTTNDNFHQLWLSDAISKLNSNEQELIYLKYFHGYTYEELSHHLKIPEGTLKTRIHFALKKLKQDLGSYKEGGWNEGLS
ncbi:sigma-70 family RNA polymerase sigma factor [Filobacillus milosensis]|uniref:sigma-70 family RNA polymerase sigma factor n=1 Tax=Filobacillus milosensis TaxID=94137 RepID=UPI001E4579E7|nr:sigma-70 family RNA polymerase sigma factor [Filobacillus milosensis]